MPKDANTHRKKDPRNKASYEFKDSYCAWELSPGIST